MVTKKGKSKKEQDIWTVWTPFIAIDYINTDFDHRLNELFLEFLQNFSWLEYFRFFSFENCLAFNKACQMNNFLIKCQRLSFVATNKRTRCRTSDCIISMNQIKESG